MHDVMRIARLKSLHDFSDGGAWPLLVGGVNCQVNSDNERDLHPKIDLLIHVLI